MSEENFQYDISISFAGEDRNVARELANILRDANVSVFFDEYKQPELIGRDLTSHLTKVYSRNARYCAILVSSAYSSKKWTMNIELPAVRDRLFESGDNYLIPILLDDTKLPGILGTVGRIDLRHHEVEDAALLICKKVLGSRYRKNANCVVKSWEKHGFLRVANNLPTNKFVDILCSYIFNAKTIELRISTYTPLRLFQSRQFRVTIEMLCHKMAENNCNGTLRLYCLSRDQEKLKPFIRLSREPLDVVLTKHNQGRELAMKLLQRPIIKEHLRIQFLHHEGFSPFHVFQCSDHLFFITPTIGEKQDSFTVYYANRNEAPPSFMRGFENMFQDIEIRASIDTLNWF